VSQPSPLAAACERCRTRTERNAPALCSVHRSFCSLPRLSELLQTKGADIFRSKGVLAVHRSAERHVFQGVHMLMALDSSEGLGLRPWAPGERRVNRLVFIGRNLDREQLNASFQDCVV
jgi:G3E family GTPase